MLSYVKAHRERITGLSIRGNQIYSSSKESFLNVYQLTQTGDALHKSQAMKINALTIIYEVLSKRDEPLSLLGFNSQHCFIWDADKKIQRLRVNTLGGNRPIRARIGWVDGQPDRCTLVYAYGDCLALAY